MSDRNTEADILSGLMDADDETVTTQNQTDATETTETTETTTTAASGSTSDGTSAGGTADTQSARTDAADAEAAPIIRKDGLHEVQSKTNPGTRDLVDPTTGRIVATGGIERHIFEMAQRHRRENDTLKQRVQMQDQQINAVSETSRVARELQLAPEHQVAAMRAMADFLRDPVKTLEFMVAEVKAKGYDIPFLEQGIDRGIDTRAISRMMDDRLAPLTAQRQQEEARQVQYQEAQNAVNAFVEAVPEALPNLKHLGEMCATDPSLNLDRAWAKLVMWAAPHGIDPAQPIEPQVRAIIARQQTTQQVPPTSQAQQQPPARPTTPAAPLPNGRGVSNAQPVRNADVVFSENSSWKDVVRASMQEAGYTLP